MRKIIQFFVRKIPRIYLIKFSYIFSSVVSVFYRGKNVHCTVCNNSFRKFLPYGNKGTDNRLCPRCLSLERHRLLWKYLNEETEIFKKKCKLLHIAPEQPFLKRFKSNKNIEYITADLESPIADIKMDIREMPFDDNSFDVVLCNHVLEHIDNEQKALKEILRVLRKGAWAILQVPLDVSLDETFEDLSITDPKEREKLFGQYDHVRLYGRDYNKRLEKAGFNVDVIDFQNNFSQEEIEKYRFDKTENIYRCNKL